MTNPTGNALSAAAEATESLTSRERITVTRELSDSVTGEYLHEDIDQLLSDLAASKAEVEKLRSRVTVLEQVIFEELDEWDCGEACNEMIVSQIRDARANAALSPPTVTEEVK